MLCACVYNFTYVCLSIYLFELHQLICNDNFVIYRFVRQKHELQYKVQYIQTTIFCNNGDVGSGLFPRYWSQGKKANHGCIYSQETKVCLKMCKSSNMVHAWQFCIHDGYKTNVSKQLLLVYQMLVVATSTGKCKTNHYYNITVLQEYSC